MTTAKEDVMEVPITEAREHLADLINHALYAGDSTYLTRRGHRVAMLVPPDALSRERAEAIQLAALMLRQAMETASKERATERPEHRWKLIRQDLSETLDQLYQWAEDEADRSSAAAAWDEIRSGAKPVPMEHLHEELGL